MIRVEGLTKDYGPRRAIHELTFDAQEGEILGFLGPNGAGKTTTMRILTGYMPETVPLYPDMTVIEYLKFMADLRRVKNSEDRAIELLEKLHMDDRAESYISNLSKGMRQRVGLAQALVHDPEVLILDEPTIGLDPAQIIEVRNLIRELGKERTILLSTHILSEAQQLIGAQRVVLQCGGDTDGIEKVVAQVHGVAGLISKEDGRLEFETTPGNDPRSQVARAVVNAGYDLLEMRPIGLSLEEIFLQLTRDEPNPPEPTEQGLDEELDEELPGEE
jgi:ABC-2 type transport system ATP-binding protein